MPPKTKPVSKPTPKTTQVVDDDTSSSESELSTTEFPTEKIEENIDDDIEEDEENEEGEEEEEEEEEENNEKEIIDDDEGCVYKFSKKKIDNDDLLEDDDLLDDEYTIKNIYVSEEDRITTRKLTKYERVRILGDRTKQISLGAQKMINNIDYLSSKEIAELELQNKKIPILIKRTLPSGEIEIIDTNSLKIIN